LALEVKCPSALTQRAAAINFALLAPVSTALSRSEVLAIMNWAESMHDNATRASRDETAMDERISLSPRPADWTPHDVWLTRVKQPRDRAALAASLGSGT
jgi:hypothetical protein